MSREEYEAAKRKYHAAGRKAKGTPDGSERAEYAEAKRDYHAAGNKLKKA